MKVTLTTMGGFVAVRRQVRTLDTTKLPESEAAQLRSLVAAAAGTAAPSPSGQVRDAMTYRIEIEDDGKTTNLKQSDGAMSPEFAALLQFLEARS